MPAYDHVSDLWHFFWPHGSYVLIVSCQAFYVSLQTNKLNLPQAGFNCAVETSPRWWHIIDTVVLVSEKIVSFWTYVHKFCDLISLFSLGVCKWRTLQNINQNGVKGLLFVHIVATRWQHKPKETGRSCSGGSVGGLVCEVLTVSEEVS